MTAGDSAPSHIRTEVRNNGRRQVAPRDQILRFLRLFLASRQFGG
jgi:hypothetical protein